MSPLESDLRALLESCEKAQPFDDIFIAAEREVVIKSSGRTYQLKGRMPSNFVEGFANVLGSGSNVANDVASGKQLDPAFSFTSSDEAEHYRYRANITSFRSCGENGLRITMRSIKNAIPSLAQVGLTEDEFSLMNGPGLTLVVGETGSGKSTTLSSIIAQMLKHETGNGRVINTYESPVEMTYDELINEQSKSFVFQHEIPRDLPCFTEAIRNALRTNPDIILLGEARERETIEMMILAALSGHGVFATLHANGYMATISRVVSSISESQRDAARVDIASCLQAVMCQRLLVGPKGRVAVREKIFIPQDVRDTLAKMESEKLKVAMSEIFNEIGVTFLEDAQRLCDEGKLEEWQIEQFR